MNQIFKKMLTTRELPTPSQLALEIMRLSSNPAASVNDIADIVEKDPALSGKILKYANTALFAAPTPIVSIKKAVIRLGTDVVMGLALGFSLLAKNRKGRCANFDYDGFWSGSLATAIAAHDLATMQPEYEPDELFVCGLLSQIGKLALACIYPQKYSEVLAGNPTESELLLREAREFSIDHTEITIELFREWGLPEKYSEVWSLLKQHPFEDSNANVLPDLASLLRLSRLLAKICIMESPLPAAEELTRQNAIHHEDMDALLGRIVSRWQEWSLFFEIPARTGPPLSGTTSVGAESVPDSQEPFCILAVDDDPQTLQIMTSLLKNSVSTILTAGTGDEALRLAVHHQPDLIIANWHMPDIGGLDLCRMLRKTEFARHLYIIILTTNESDDELVQAFDAGADDYMGKPFIPKVLEARIRGGRRIVGYQEKMHQDRAIIQDYADTLTAVNRRFHTLAMTDPLTGLSNRRHAMERLKEIITASRHSGNMFSCIMIDIDHFKKINDTYGHDSGDLVLQEIAAVFRKKSRTTDTISRMGGEEFLVISEQNSLEKAVIFAERLRQHIADHEIALQETTIRVTISLGIAVMSPGITESGTLLLLADQALYKAKEKGRNRVEIAMQHGAG
ncbi:MAG: diguanylate cyclase [Desulfocapsaceae bacterium]|nr:diguanylate cyclase [Desulfocapsaceae bacterium]